MKSVNFSILLLTLQLNILAEEIQTADLIQGYSNDIPAWYKQVLPKKIYEKCYEQRCYDKQCEIVSRFIMLITKKAAIINVPMAWRETPMNTREMYFMATGQIVDEVNQLNITDVEEAMVEAIQALRPLPLNNYEIEQERARARDIFYRDIAIERAWKEIKAEHEITAVKS